MSPAAFVLSHFSGAVMRGSPTLCQAPVAISGWKIWMLHNFSFCGTSCAGALHHAETELEGLGRALNVLTLYGTPICWG